MFYKGGGRDRVGLAGGRTGCVCMWGGGGGERLTDTDRQTETDTERVAIKICCFSTVLQVTAVEVKPIC